MNAYWEVEVQLYAFTPTLDGGTGRFTPRERTTSAHWMDPRTGFGTGAKRKHPSSYRESNLGRPARSLIPLLTEQSRLRNSQYLS
jgi:hypothetical protein